MFLKFQQMEVNEKDEWAPVGEHTLVECKSYTYNREDRTVYMYEEGGISFERKIPENERVYAYVMNNEGGTIDTLTFKNIADE